MKSREWNQLKKAHDEIYKNLNALARRQDLINQFFAERMTQSECIELRGKLDEFEESERPENIEKRKKVVIDRLLGIDKTCKPIARKEVKR